MNDLIAEGYYDVKPVSWGSGLSKEKKTPQAWVKFENGLFWQGYVSDYTFQSGPNEGKTMTEVMVDQLAMMGFNGASLNDLNNENALNKTLAVNVNVKHETTDKGLKIAKVAWINPLYKKKEVTPEETKVLGGVDLRAYVASSKKELGITEVTKEITTDDIPF